MREGVDRVMTGAFDVSVSALRAAAESVRAAGAETAGIDLAGAATGVGGALAGSDSAAVAAGLAESWRVGINGLAQDLTVQGEGLGSAATAYTGADDRAAGGLSAVEIPGF